MSDALKETRTAIKQKISEIKKVKDPGERFLQFNELHDNVSAAYDRGCVNKSFRFTDGDFLFNAAMGTIAGVVPGVVITGWQGVKKLKLPKAVKHANKMDDLRIEIRGEIKALSHSINIEALIASPRAEEIVEKFPDLKEAFDHHASVIAAREKLVAKPAPAAKPGPQI